MIGLSPLWLAALGERADVYGRQFLLDAATGFLLPPFPANYTRSGPDLWCPQADGSLASFAANVIPREWANARWGFRFDPGWTQSFLQTHLLNNAAWGLTGLQTPTKTALGPNGANDSWALTETTAAATGTGGGQGISCVAGQAYTIKAVVSSRTGNRFFGVVFTAAGFGGNLAANINPVDGTVTVNSGSITAGSRQLANGNWELWATATATATGSFGILFRLSTAQTLYFPNYTGDGVSGVNVHALNLTNTAYPVPLTVAQGTAGTVGNHSCSALLSALGISLGAEYTFGVEYVPFGTVAGHVARVDDGTAATNVLIYTNGAGAMSVSARTANVGIYSQSNAATNGVLLKTATRVKENQIRAAISGVLKPGSATTGAIPPYTHARLGTSEVGAAIPSCAIGRVWIAPTRALTDTELQAVTA